MNSTIIWLAKPGEKIQKGDLICRLDASVLSEKLQQQKISYETVAVELVKSQSQLEFIKKQSQSLFAAASKRLDAAKKTLESFAGAEGIAKSEIRQLEAQLAAEEEKLKHLVQAGGDDSVQIKLQIVDTKLAISTIKRSLIGLKTNVHPAKLAELEAVVATKQAESDEVRSKFEAELAGAEARLASSNSAKKIEKLKLEGLEKQLASSSIVSPVAGHFVVQDAVRNPIEIGSLVRENQVIARIVDGDAFRARVLVNESRISKVKVGQTVLVAVAALPSKKIEGKVTKIARFPERTSILDNDVKKYAVEVQLDASTGQLRDGMTAMAEIKIK